MDAAGGGWLMPQDRFTVEALAARLKDLFDMPASLQAAAGAARAYGVPDAARRLADLVEAKLPTTTAATSAAAVARETAQ